MLTKNILKKLSLQIGSGDFYLNQNNEMYEG